MVLFFVLAIVEQADHLSLVWLATVSGILPLPDVGAHGVGIGEPCSLYIDGKQPKAEQRELERGEGSKISRVC